MNILNDPSFSRACARDEFLGPVLQLSDASGERWIEIQRLTHSASESAMQEKLLNERRRVKCPYFLRLVEFRVEKLKPDLTQYRMLYEYPEISLRQLISEAKPADDETLIYLVYHVLTALKALEDNKLFHGLVAPDCIFLKQGLWKLAMRPVADSLQPEDIVNRNAVLNKPIYVSQKAWKQAMRGEKVADHNRAKSDVFSLGLCLLEFGLGESVQAVYGAEGVKEDVLCRLLEKFKARFSKFELLPGVMSLMLQTREELVSDPTSILSRMPEYEEACRILEESKSRKQPTDSRLNRPSTTRPATGTVQVTTSYSYAYPGHSENRPTPPEKTLPEPKWQEVRMINNGDQQFINCPQPNDARASQKGPLIDRFTRGSYSNPTAIVSACPRLQSHSYTTPTGLVNSVYNCMPSNQMQCDVVSLSPSRCSNGLTPVSTNRNGEPSSQYNGVLASPISPAMNLPTINSFTSPSPQVSTFSAAPSQPRLEGGPIKTGNRKMIDQVMYEEVEERRKEIRNGNVVHVRTLRWIPLPPSSNVNMFKPHSSANLISPQLR